MEEMPKKYEFTEAEKRLKERWEKERIYAFDEQSKKPVFSIDTPPPTVSGSMHLGHSFSFTHQDIIARFQRMRGKNVFYPFGTDDNGLATDRLVEKTKKVKSKSMQRDEYSRLALETVRELLPAFIEDWKKLGMSCDFERPYSTISPDVQRVSQKAFIRLYKKGLVYRKETPVSWCPQCQTAIAQAEFENVEMSSHFNDIVFKSGGQDLVIATTRPELLPACVGLFYHPDDERYAKLKGKFAKVPLFDYEVPILPDESVDKEKGTGLMMCCTFGDKEDIEKWYRHRLPLKVVFTRDGKLNEQAVGYEGLAIREARQRIIADLEGAGLLLTSKKISHPVNVHERCGTEIEFLNTQQWFIDVLGHKAELIKAADEIQWHPQHMKTRYVHWVENLNWDWCISRQRHFGIPFPVWYTADGEIVLPDESELPVDPLSQLPKGHKDLIPESDVIDTWATSSITPMIAMGWDKDHDSFTKKFPMDVRPQAHDIIRTWAFYTIARGIFHEGVVPWRNIMISGFVLDPKGNKMSKSKGNTIAPQDVLERFGADALRFWAAGSKLGDDLPYQEKDVQTGSKTVTKLWNASRFALMQLQDYDGQRPKQLQVVDRWIISRLQSIIRESTQTYENYEYAKSKALVDNFFWNTFCDYYLEVIKDRIYNPEVHGDDAKRSAQYTLSYALNTILKLFAPIMPYITEEVYQYAFAEKEGHASIHSSGWPVFDEKLIDTQAEAAGELLVLLIGAARRKKSSANVSLRTPITSFAISCSPEQQVALESVMADFKAATCAQVVVFGDADEDLAEGIKVSIVLGQAEKK